MRLFTSNFFCIRSRRGRPRLPITPKTLSLYVSRYLKASVVAHTGSCHLFRHAMATLMLENGAVVLMIQAILGHVKLTTTEIHTHVAITKLKEIHSAMHPAARLLPGRTGNGGGTGA